jgi:peptidoglycan-associated lipoprotein
MQLRSLVLAGLMFAVACGKKKPETTPEPTSGPVTPPPAPAPAPPPPPIDNSAAEAAMRAELMGSLTAPIHFEYDQDAISSMDAAILDRKAAIMQANPGVRIRISGHADDRGSDEYNLVLGTKRATAAKRYLESKGIDGGRVDIISYGEERPVDRGENDAAWAKNRRDEFEVLSGADRLVAPR